MEVFIGYMFFAALVGAMSTERVIGFWGGFLWSIVLSPVIGLIIMLCSKSKDTLRREQAMSRDARKQTEILQHMALQTKKNNQENLSDELAKWKKQCDDGIITQEEYQKIKNRIMAQFD